MFTLTEAQKTRFVEIMSRGLQRLREVDPEADAIWSRRHAVSTSSMNGMTYYCIGPEYVAVFEWFENLRNSRASIVQRSDGRYIDAAMPWVGNPHREDEDTLFGSVDGFLDKLEELVSDF